MNSPSSTRIPIGTRIFPVFSGDRQAREAFRRRLATCLFPVPLLLAAEARAQPLTLDRVAVDFGTVGLHAQSEASLVLTNASDRTVRFKHTDSDCVCLDSRIAQAALGPGETTEWVVALNTCAYTGEVRRHVWVETDHPDLLRMKLPIRYRVVPALYAEPSFVALGLIGDSTVEAAVSIRTCGAEPIRIRSVSCGGRQVDAGIVSATVTRGQPGVVRIFVPPMPEGRFRASLWVETDSPDVPRLEIPIFGESIRGVRSNRRRIDFGEVRLGAAESLSTVIRHNSSVRIGGIRPSNDAVTVKILDRRDGQISIALTPSPDLPLGRFNGFLIIEANNGQSRRLKLPYRGRILPAAARHRHVAAGAVARCGESAP